MAKIIEFKTGKVLADILGNDPMLPREKSVFKIETGPAFGNCVLGVIAVDVFEANEIIGDINFTLTGKREAS